ncbi:60S ribosomal protein L24 [Paraphaeosphaeria minitans]
MRAKSLLSFWDSRAQSSFGITAAPRPPRQLFILTNRYRVTTANMRTYDDSFSGEKIYPGKGKLYIRGDSKIFRFQNGKTESLFLQRKNPRRIAWTVLFRRQHKKGLSEEVAKKRTRRTVKHQRAIVGASLDVIKERRSQRPEARSAARAAAIKEGKEKRADAESKKKAEKAKSAAAGARGNVNKVSKQGAKGAAPKVQARTR